MAPTGRGEPSRSVLLQPLRVTSYAHEFLDRPLDPGDHPRQYLERTGMTFEDLKKEFEPQAEKRAKGALVLEAIGKAEGIDSER